MHLFALSTAQFHLLVSCMLALTAGTHGLVVGLAVAVVMSLRHLVRRHLDHPSPERTPAHRRGAVTPAGLAPARR